MIRPSQLFSHSKRCLGTSPYLSKILQQDEISQLDYKIERLKSSMEEYVNSSYLEESYRYKYTFKQLIVISAELLLCGRNIEDARCCENIVLDIIHLGPFPNTNLYVYMERLKNLAEVRSR